MIGDSRFAEYIELTTRDGFMRWPLLGRAGQWVWHADHEAPRTRPRYALTHEPSGRRLATFATEDAAALGAAAMPALAGEFLRGPKPHLPAALRAQLVDLVKRCGGVLAAGKD